MHTTGLLHVRVGKGRQQHLPYFLEFFPWVLLTSECVNMGVQFEGGDNRRADTTIIAALPHLYAYCAPSRFSLNEHEI